VCPGCGATAHTLAHQGADQGTLANIREADKVDSDALGRARFVRLEEAEQRRRGSRGTVRALVRARRAERGVSV